MLTLTIGGDKKVSAFENRTFGSSTEWDQAYQSDLERQKSNNLAEYESRLINEQDEHPWWSFFDGGVKDEDGTMWSVYNRWCDETQANGWKVVRCPYDQSEFREIPVSRVVRQEVYPATADREGLTTFQLSIRDEMAGLTNHDVLNVLLYHSEDEVRPKLKMWNRAHPMTPVPKDSLSTPRGAEYLESQESLELAV